MVIGSQDYQQISGKESIMMHRNVVKDSVTTFKDATDGEQEHQMFFFF